MLQRGDIVPQFEVGTVRGAASYATIWQQQNLALATLPAAESDLVEQYASELNAHAAEFSEQATTCVVTHDAVVGLRAPGVLVADRWGEIVHIVHGVDVRDLPGAAQLLEWVEYVQRRCPECEGESK